MAYATSGQDYLFLPIMTERTRSLANYGMYFVDFFINLVVPTVLLTF